MPTIYIYITNTITSGLLLDSDCCSYRFFMGYGLRQALRIYKSEIKQKLGIKRAKWELIRL